MDFSAKSKLSELVLLLSCLLSSTSQFAAGTTPDAVSKATPLTYLHRRVGMNFITDISTDDALTFNPAAKPWGTISYRLSFPARIRIRIVLRNQPSLVLTTLVDMAERPSGINTERWNGRDQSGNMVDNTKCFFVIQAAPPPHDRHNKQFCKELNVRLQSTKTELENLHHQIVWVNLLKEEIFDKNCPYTINFFMGNKQIFQKEIVLGQFPFAWLLKTEMMSSGYHLLMVNVSDSFDHIGVASMRIHIP